MRYFLCLFILLCVGCTSSRFNGSLETSDSSFRQAQERYFLKGDLEGSIPLFEVSCREGVGEACLFLLQVYSYNFVQTDLQNASRSFFQQRTELLAQTKKALEQGCSAKKANDCFQLALFYRSYLFQNKKAEELLLKTCELGYAMGCIRVQDREQLFNSGFMQLENECKSGRAESCRWLGVIYATDPRATSKLTDTQIQTKTKELLEQACRLGDLVACGKTRGYD